MREINVEIDWKLVLKESHVRSKGIEIVLAFRDMFVHLIMSRLNLSTYTSRSIWHALSPGSLLASHLFHVFKGDKLAWGSKKRSEGNHDFWQRHLWLLWAANGKRIWDFHFFFRCRHISRFWTPDFPITFLPVIFDILDCFKKGFILHQQTFNKNSSLR